MARGNGEIALPKSLEVLDVRRVRHELQQLFAGAV
jgi:hypothetical protein